MAETEYRIEHDTMGEVRVPASALYGAQTQRAVENFPISGDVLAPAQIVALARIKKAAAQANKALGTLDERIADAIARAADRIIAGEHADQFPIDVYSQSSNDVFPTSVHIAATQELIDDLIPALDHLAVALEEKASLWKDAVKSGRTHLMDATPVTLGQEFGGYARQIRLGIERVQSVLPRVAEVPLGGTAVGTGINTPAGFPQKVLELIVAETELPITEAKDHFEAQANRDGLVEASGALRTIAVSLTKINNDLRWMGSGPNTGLGELHIPDLQPGSSIMPGKVNPVVPEATLMVCARVIGNDATIAWAGASGSFELNVAIPVMGTALLESIRLLANTVRVLADKTITGLEANLERAAAYAGMSPSIVTPLNKLIGYEAAAKIAKHSVAKGITIREAVIDLGYLERGELTAEQLDEKLDLLSMTHPG
ncbi:MAG: aspA [Microbacterium sp.]|nr:aspA [Microbacterium sp.]